MTRYWMRTYARLWRRLPERWRRMVLAFLAGGLTAAALLRLLGIA